jgi:hypothetical protein
MIRADWGYTVRSSHAPTLLDELVAASSAASRADLVHEWAAFVATLDDETRWRATADNVGRDATGLVVLRTAPAAPINGDAAATSARLVWYLAFDLAHSGATFGVAMDRNIDELALQLSTLAGFALTTNDLDRFVVGEARAIAAAEPGGSASTIAGELRAAGLATPRTLAVGGALELTASHRALVAAYEELSCARADRDRAEVDAIELASARALVAELGAELERDEWIRARLRRIKTLAVFRAAVSVRRSLTVRRQRAER